MGEPPQSKPSKSESSSKKEREKVPEASFKIPPKNPEAAKKKAPKPEPGPQFHPAVKPYKPPAHYKRDWVGEDIAPKKAEGWTKTEVRKPKPDPARLSKTKEEKSDYYSSSSRRDESERYGDKKSSKGDVYNGRREVEKVRTREEVPEKKKDDGRRRFDP